MAPAFDPEALRRARVVAGLTQHELARRIGVAGGERVSQWERGTSEPRPGSVRQIARVLKVPAATLMANSADLDLRAMRTVAGLTASELAKRADISLSTLNRWEAGRFTRMPRRASVELLARALGRRVHEVEAALSHFVSKDGGWCRSGSIGWRLGEDLGACAAAAGLDVGVWRGSTVVAGGRVAR